MESGRTDADYFSQHFMLHRHYEDALRVAQSEGDKRKWGAFLNLIEQTPPIHPITGFLGKEIYPYNCHHSMQIAERSKPDDEYETLVYRVSADVNALRTFCVLMNGGDVSADDPDGTPCTASDKGLAIIAYLFQHNFTQAARRFSSGLDDKINASFYIDGGDEFLGNLTLRQKKGLTGADQKNVNIYVKAAMDDAADRTEKDVRQLVGELGLSDIMHAKHKDVFKRRGLGVALSVKQIPSILSLDQIIDAMEAEIKALKESGGRIRRAGDKNGNSAQSSGPGIAHERRIEPNPSLNGERDGLIYKNGMVVQLNESKLKEVTQNLDEYFSAFFQRDHFESPQFPFHDVQVTQDELHALGWKGINPAAKRTLQVEKKAVELGLDDEERGVFLKIYRSYEDLRQRDGVLFDPPESFIDNYLAMNRTKEDKKHALVMAVSIPNMSGLNQTYEHDGCNHIVDELTRPLRAYNNAADDAKPYVIRPNGKDNMFYVIFPDATQQAVDEEIAAMKHRISQYEGFMGGQKIEHPRHLEKPNMQGMKLHFASVDLDSRNPQGRTWTNGTEVMSALRPQLENEKNAPAIMQSPIEAILNPPPSNSGGAIAR